MTFDGEKLQINGYKYDEMVNLFSLNNVHLGKLAASCKEIEQPCDCGHIFLGTKTLNKNIDDPTV